MIVKDDIYGSGGELGPAKTPTDFRMAAGIESNFVALASDVNAYHNMSDKDLWAVCQELVNLLKAYNIQPANTYNAEDQKQLARLFSTSLPTSYSLTGIDSLGWTGAVPTQSGNSITFPQFDVVFNTDVLYGNTQSQHQRATVAATTVAATSAWENGVHFLYAETTPGSNIATIRHQQTPVLAKDGATKCMLGSVFVIDGAFQSDSWKFQPWLQITSPEHRELPTAMTKGGFVTPNAGTSVRVGTLEILDEGINWGVDRNSPNIMEVQGATTATEWKFVYPNYSATTASSADIVTTQICDLDSGSLVDIPASQAEQPSGAFVIMVPCITPAGQFLLVPPMGRPAGDGYTQVYKSQAEAANAIYSQEYSINNPAGNSVIERAIFLGYSLVVKVGATDFTDPEQFLAIGVVPQQLAGFASAGGQSGGGSGAYVPMRSFTFPASAPSVALINNAVNVITGNADNVVPVSLPATNPSTVNQLEIHYSHNASKKGLSFPDTDTLKWWGAAPRWVEGQVYNIIIEYVEGAWRAGYLTMKN